MIDQRERHRRLCECFAELADLDSRERRTRISAIAVDDPAMAAELEAMIEVDVEVTRAEMELKSVIRSAAGSIFDDPGAMVGARIGHYRIERLLGYGGMGRVYEATQEAPARRVALKVLDARIMSKAVLSRFRHETEFMGRLVHAGIAQIYEAGAERTAHGSTPWFAMELVPNALSLVEAAQERSLDVPRRIDLFLRVCDAVAFGHERGVIHRDLKPANILVDRTSAELQPKIIDFGVARSIEAEVSLATQRTEAGQILGTLHYMSPEQLSGDVDAVDVRTDVYALGLVLFELLTDRMAFDLRDLPLPEALRRLAQMTPARLREAAPAERRPQLDGDLQTIVSKAVERDPARRYGSVSEFMQDLRRLRTHEPILARPPSAFYTVRLFARRNRAIVGGAVATMAVHVLGLVGTAIGLVRATAAEHEAERARDSARYDSYVANVIAAEAALRTHDVRLARERLDSAPTEHRGWEWRHLRARTNRSAAGVESRLHRSQAIAISPDGSRIVAGDLQGEVCAYDVATLHQQWRLRGTTQVRSIRFTSDGARAALVFGGFGVVVLDAATGAEIGRRELAGATHAWFDGTNEHVLVAQRGAGVHRWSLVDDSVVALRGEGAPSDAARERTEVVATSLDGRFLLESDGRQARVTRVEDGARVGLIEPASGADLRYGVTAAAFSSDSTRVAALLDDVTLVVLSIETGQEVRSPISGSRSLLWSPGDESIVVPDGTGALELRDPQRLQIQGHLQGHDVPVAAMAQSESGPRGPAIATLDWSGALLLWSPRTRDVYRHEISRAWIYSVAFGPDGTWFAASSGENPAGEPMVARHETRTGRRVWASPPGPAGHLTFRCDVDTTGELVVHDATGAVDAIVRDAATGREVGRIPRAADSSAFPSVAWRPHTRQLLSHGRRDWSLFESSDTSRALRRFAQENSNESAMSDDGRWLLLSPRPETGFTVFDMETGAIVATPSTPETVWSADFSPDGRFAAVRFESGDLQLWSTHDWSLVRGWQGDGYGGREISFEPGGRLLGLVAGGMRVWDVERGRELVTIPLAIDPASKIGVSRDGSWAGVGGTDGSVVLFDAPLVAKETNGHAATKVTVAAPTAE